MISQRLRGVKEDGEAIEEAGFIPKLKSMFAGVGIDIEDSNGELRSTYDILNDLAGVWDQLNSKQKQYFGEKIAGNRQVKTLNAIMQNWDVVSDTLAVANGAEGAALEGNEMYMDSIQGKITQLQSALQELATTTIDSSIVKFFVDLGIAIVKLTTQIGGLGPVVGVLAGAFLAVKATNIVNFITSIGTAIKGVITGVGTASSLMAGWVGVILAVVSAIIGIVTAVNNANNSMKKLETAKSAYDEQKSKVENLNSELQNTQQLISDLESKGHLTFVEEKELENLKETNEELEKQIDLENERLRLREAELRSAAIKAEKDYKAKNSNIDITPNMVEELSSNGSQKEGSKRVAEIIGLDPSVLSMDESDLLEQLIDTTLSNEQTYALYYELFENAIKKTAEAREAWLKADADSREEAYEEYEKWQSKKDTYAQFIEGYMQSQEDIFSGISYIKNPVTQAEKESNAYLEEIQGLGKIILEGANTGLTYEQEVSAVISKYPKAGRVITESIEEAGEAWSLDDLKIDGDSKKIVDDYNEIIDSTEGIIDNTEKIGNIKVHQTLGDILEETYGTGNVDVLNRKILSGKDMLDAGWVDDFEGYEDEMVTYFSSAFSSGEDIEVPFSVSATPIDKDGNILSPGDFYEYMDKLFSEATSAEDLMALDKKENNLVIHYTLSTDVEGGAEAAAQAEAQVGQTLHVIDYAFEQWRLSDFGQTNVNFTDFLKQRLQDAISDPSAAGDILNEVFTLLSVLGEKLAAEGDTYLQDALGNLGIDVESIITEGLGFSDISIDDIDMSAVDNLITDLREQLHLDKEQIQRLLYENFAPTEVSTQQFIPQFTPAGVAEEMFTTTDSYKALTKAMQEQEKAGEISAATWTALLSDEGLAGVSELLIQTANGYALNTKGVYDFIEAKQKEDRINAVAGIIEQQKEIEKLEELQAQLTNSTEDLALAQEYQSKIESAQNEIDQYSALIKEIDGATSALERYRAASKTPDQDSDHTEGQGIYKTVQERFESGKVGTDDFKEGMSFLLGGDWQTKFTGDLEGAYKEAQKIGERYFGEDDYKGATNFAQDLADKGFATYDKNTGKLEMLQNEATGTTYTFEEMAEAFGMSEDAIASLFGLLDSYSLESQFDYTKPITSAEELAVAEEKLAEKQERLAELEKELQEARENGEDTTELQEEYNKTTGEVDALTSALETAYKTIEENGTLDTSGMGIDEALAKIQELQDAINTLEINAVTPNVELGAELKQLIEFIEGGNGGPGSYQIQVNDIGDAQERLAEIDKNLATLKELENSGAISPEIAAEITGNYELQKAALNEYIKQAEEIQGDFPDGDLTATITGEANVEGIVAFKENWETVRTEVSNNPAELSAEEDPNNNASTVKASWEDIFKGFGITISPSLDEEQKQALLNDIKDIITDKIIKFIPDDTEIKTLFDYLNDPSNLQWLTDLYGLLGKLSPGEGPEPGDSSVIQLSQGEIPPIPLPVDKGDIADQVEEAAEDGADKANPEVTPETNSDILSEEIEEAADGAEPKTTIEPETDNIPDQIENAIPDEVPVTVTPEVEPTPTPTPSPTPTPTPAPEVKGAMSLDNSGAMGAISEVDAAGSKGVTKPIDGDTSELDRKIDKADSEIKQHRTMPVGMSINTKSFDDLKKDIGTKKTQEVEVKYTEVNKPAQLAVGTSNAKGGLSLVDEKGAELIEHTSKGTFELGTNNGPRFTTLDKGDVVHTASETKKILSRLGGIGGVFRDGLNKAKSIFGRAFASGGVGGGVTIQKPTKRVAEDARSRSRGRSSDKEDKSGGKKLKKFKEWAEKLFDWAEIRLARLKTITNTFLLDAQRAIGSIAKNKELKSAMKAIDDEIVATGKAYDKYIQQADKVAKKAGLSKDIVKKIQTGDIKISEYSKATQEKIKEYQEWYEKALDCLDALDELEEQQKEIAKQRLDNIITDYGNRADLIEGKIGIREARRDYQTAAGEEIIGADLSKPIGKRGYGDFQDDIDLKNSEYKTLVEERRRLNEELRELMEEGTVKKGDEIWQEYTKQIQDLDAAIIQTRKDVLDLVDAATKVELEKLDFRRSQYQSDSAKWNYMIDITSARGSKSISGQEKYYKSMISDAEKENALIDQQNAELLAQQKQYDKGSEKYRQIEEQIQKNKEAQRQNNLAIEEWKDAIASIPLKELGYGLDELQDKATEVNNKMALDLATGTEITSSGYQSLINNANQQRNNLLAQRKVYEDEMRKMVEEYGPDAKESEKYKQLESSVRDLDSSMASLDLSVVEWEKDIKNLKTQKLQWQLDTLAASAQKMEESISLAEARGVGITASSYRALIDNANAQRQVEYELISHYHNLQSGMDINSEEYQDLEKKIQTSYSNISGLDIAIEGWKDAINELKLNDLTHSLDNLQSTEKYLTSKIENDKQSGVEITEDRLNKLIELEELQMQNYTSQKEYYEELMRQMVASYGQIAKQSDKYREYEKSVNALDQSMIDLTGSTIKLKKEVWNLRLQKLGYQLDDLVEKTDKINDSISLHSAQAIDEVSDTYEKLIQLGFERINVLKEENKLLKEQQKGMDVESEAYQELEKQIRSNEKEVNSIKVSQEEWNDNIVDLGINNIQKYRDMLERTNDEYERQKALQEAIENIEKVRAQRKVRTYIEGQGFVYQASEDDLKKAQENLENVIKDQLLYRIDNLIDALEESKADTNVYDKDGNLIGTAYNPPELGSLESVLASYMEKGSTIDMGVLADAFGDKFVSSIGASTNSNTINIGDIIVNEAKDGNELAGAIINQLPNALLQAMYKK